MYCRKCGKKLADDAKFCDGCGEQVVRGEAPHNAKKGKKEEKKHGRIIHGVDVDTLKNPYIIPAYIASGIAFLLGIFPWQKSWGIGTSWWMKLLILALSALGLYHCIRAKQTNKAYKTKYGVEIEPGKVQLVTIIAIMTAMAATFSLFM